MHERIRIVLLDRWARLVTTRPKTTLTLALLLAGICIAATWQYLEFRPDRSDLIDADLVWNKRYFEHKANFPRWNDLIVCLEGDPDDERIHNLARTIADELRLSDRISAADAGYNAAEASARMFRAAPDDGTFESALTQLREGQTLIGRAPNANAALTHLTNQLKHKATRDEQSINRLPELRRILRPYLEALYDNKVSFKFLNVKRDRWIPLRSESGRIRFIKVHFKTHTGTVDAVSDNIRWLRDQIANTVGQSDLPTLQWGVTGIPAIEADETAQSIRDSTLASILAFALITALMVAVFRGITVPLLAAATLLIGIAWSFGWLILSVGHLQLLSVVFTVILLGIGIDFAVHLLARLELLRDTYDNLPDAMSRVFQSMGPGLITGALTTAAAFGVTALTKFRGMAEMGTIAAGGIVLCLIAAFCVLPALLALVGWKRVIRLRTGGEAAHFAHGRLDAVDRRPALTLLLAAVVIALMIWPAARVQYDPNILKLHPPGIESVQWEQRVVADDSRSAWAAMAHVNKTNAATLTDEFASLPNVSGVGGVGTLYPVNRQHREQEVAKLRDRSITPIDAENTSKAMMNQLRLIQHGVRAAIDVRSTDRRAAKVVADIELAYRNWVAMDDATQQERYQRVERAYSEARNRLQNYIQQALAPGPLVAADLPPLLQQMWVGTDGRWLLEIYPAKDSQARSILHPDRLGEFVTTVRQVDVKVFGPPVQIYESSELIKREYLRAAVFALAAVLIILLVDFRSLADALSAIVPVSIGFLGAFAMLGIVGMPLNFANIIVMPLIFGIGVDAGVHMVHRWRVEPSGRPAGLSGATGRGITITMLTTIIGFGCMLTAQHRGIRSLGMVMVAGLAVTLMACYFVLPALLRLRTTQSMINKASQPSTSQNNT